MHTSYIAAGAASLFWAASAQAEPIPHAGFARRFLDGIVDVRDFAPADSPSFIGCYSSAQGLTFQSSAPGRQSSGLCQTTCAKSLGMMVEAMVNGTDCYCGSTFPPLVNLVDKKFCSKPCEGFGADSCGSYSAGQQYWSVYNSGLSKNDAITNATASATSTTAASTSAPTAAQTSVKPVETVVVTPTNTPTSAPVTDSGPNKAGIAAGVVVGVVAIAAIAGAIWFFVRQRRRREVEEEHKRQAAISAFTATGKPGSSAGSMPDTRLDPAIMTQRRMSDGSIMDNQDYSRRILKVTNA